MSQKTKIRFRRLVISLCLIAALIGGARWWQHFHAPLAPTRFVQALGSAQGIAYSDDGQRITVLGGGWRSEVSAITGQVLQSTHYEEKSASLPSFSTSEYELKTEYEATSKCTLVRLKNKKTGRIEWFWQSKPLERVVTVLPDFSRFVASDYLKPSSRVVEIGTGRTLAVVNCALDSLSTQLVHENQWLLCGGYDNYSALLRVENLRPVYKQLQMPKLKYVRLLSDQRIVGTDGSGTLHSWELPSCRHKAIKTGFDGAGWVLPAKNTLIVSVWHNKPQGSTRSFVQVRSWDGATLLRQIPGYPEGFSPNARFLMFATDKGNFHGNWQEARSFEIWDTRTGDRIAECNPHIYSLGQTFANGDQSFLSLVCAVSPDGRQCAIGDNSGLVRLYDLVDTTGHSTGFVSTSGGYEAGAEGTEAFEEWKASQNSAFSNEKLHFKRGRKEFNVISVASSPVGSQVVYAGVGIERVKPTPQNNTGINLTGEKIIEIRNRTTNSLPVTLEAVNEASPNSFYQCRWSPDGSLVAASDDRWGRVVWWDSRTGKIQGQISRPRPQITTPILVDIPYLLISHAFSPDNRFLVAAQRDGAIYLYSTQTRLPVAQIGKCASPVVWVSFSADGRKVYGLPNSAVELKRGSGASISTNISTDEEMAQNILCWNVPALP